MITREIREYLTKKERQSFDAVKLCQDFTDFVSYRDETNADAMMDVGIRCWKERLEHGVFGNIQSEQAWVNVTWEKIDKKISRLLATRVDVTLENRLKRFIVAQDILEKNVNFAIEFFDMLRSCDYSVMHKAFLGFGVVKYEWDKYEERDGWKTGIPKVRTVDPRCFLLPPNCSDKYLKDADKFFEIKTYEKTKFFEKLRSGAIPIKGDVEKVIKMIESGKSYLRGVARKGWTYNTSTNYVEVVICQYLRPHYTKTRKLESVFNDGVSYDVLDSDLRKEVGEEKMSKVEDFDDRESLPEGMAVTKPEMIRYNAWYETILLPSYDTEISPPRCIGDKSTYCLMPGVPNPDSSYPISDAFRQAESQHILNSTLSMHLVAALRKLKSLPYVVKSGIDNWVDFKDGYPDEDTVVVINKEFIETPGKLEKPVGFITPPGSSPDLQNIIGLLESWIAESTSSTPIQDGFAQGSHQSGRALNILTANNINSSKSDFNPYLFLLTNLFTLAKDSIAEYKNYVYLEEYFGVEFLVNETLDTSMIAAAPNCYVKIVDEAGNEELKAQRAEKYERLLDKGYVPIEIALQKMDLDDPEKVLDLKSKQDRVYALAKELEDRPDLFDKLYEMVQNELARENNEKTLTA